MDINEHDIQIPLKVVLLGDSGTGKTSIINRWISNTFSIEIRPTIGCNNYLAKRVNVMCNEMGNEVYSTNHYDINNNNNNNNNKISNSQSDHISGKYVNLLVWDTAGQEEYHSLTPLYLRDAAITIVVCAVNDQKSINSLKKWVVKIGDSSETPPPAILAVNKMDEADNAVNSINEFHEMFDTLFVAMFFVSALSGENIDELFQLAGVEAYAFYNRIIRVKEGKDPVGKADGNKGGCC